MHTKSANRIKMNDSLISIWNMHKAILQKTTKEIEPAFYPGSDILPEDLSSWAFTDHFIFNYY